MFEVVWLLALVGHNWGHIFQDSALWISFLTLPTFQPQCYCNTSLILLCFGLCFVFMPHLFFSEVSDKAFLSCLIQYSLLKPDMDSEGLWASARHTCLCLRLCHAWLPTWCLQEFWKDEAWKHSTTIWQSLTPYLGRCKAWKEERSVCLKVSSWVLADESVEGLEGFQEPILPPHKPPRNTNWSPPNTKVGSRQSSWRQCPDQLWYWSNMPHSDRDILWVVNCSLGAFDLLLTWLMDLYFLDTI